MNIRTAEVVKVVKYIPIVFLFVWDWMHTSLRKDLVDVEEHLWEN